MRISLIRFSQPFLLFALLLVADSASAQIAALDLIDLIAPRSKIDARRTGVNAFANDQDFGPVRSQYREVRNTLRLKYVRVLFAWNDDVQPSADSAINFSFYDEIARSLPARTQALVVLTGVPSWMQNPENWIDGDPRKTFVSLWVEPVLRRYRKRSKLKAYQIWNEPNSDSFGENAVLQVLDSPENYRHMLCEAKQVFARVAPRRKVVNAATTAINQDFPDTLNYNQELQSLGVEDCLDYFAFHYYGSAYETLIVPGGVSDFLNSIAKPLWLTESGERGVNNQLEYVERTWTLLNKQITGIKRFYYYQFTEDSGPDSTYGLRTKSASQPVSDLYIWLRDR